VGLITSLEGAAVRDVVINLTRRFPAARLVVRGVRVQGEDAVGDIIKALEVFNAAFAVDVLILARGGGSLEDLHPFNTEKVARAIRASTIPVVTGVGHEPDITLADLAADFRASTPTGAAEAVVPSSPEVIALLGEVQASMLAHTRHILHRFERCVVALEKRRPYSDPTMMVSQAMQRLAEEEAGLASAARSSLLVRERKVEALSHALSRYPREYRDLPRRLDATSAKLSSAVAAWMRWRGRDPLEREKRLRSAAPALLAREEGRVRLAASRLEALSPLAVLARGYSIVTRAGEGKPLTDSAEVKVGDDVDVRLYRGRLHCEVKGSEE
jgi:exodeoxyribonuclease VII large subunit